MPLAALGADGLFLKYESGEYCEESSTSVEQLLSVGEWLPPVVERFGELVSDLLCCCC